jgi:hypothetical protein
MNQDYNMYLDFAQDKISIISISKKYNKTIKEVIKVIKN